MMAGPIFPKLIDQENRIFFFLPFHGECGIIVPLPGIELVPPALGAQGLNHWTTREVRKALSVCSYSTVWA